MLDARLVLLLAKTSTPREARAELVGASAGLEGVENSPSFPSHVTANGTAWRIRKPELVAIVVWCSSTAITFWPTTRLLEAMLTEPLRLAFATVERAIVA